MHEHDAALCADAAIRAFWEERLGDKFDPELGSEEYLDRDGYELGPNERARYEADMAILREAM